MTVETWTPTAWAPPWDALLAPIAADEPAGPSLRYLPVYGQIRDARSEEDAGLPMGDWSRPLKRADWRAVESLCTEVLCQRSKDLQVAAWLVQAWVIRHGMPGLVAGARLIEGLCTAYWNDVHPRIDEGDTDIRTAPLAWISTSLAHSLLLHVPLLPGMDGTAQPIPLSRWQQALAQEYGGSAALRHVEQHESAEHAAHGEAPLTREALLENALLHGAHLAALGEQAALAQEAWQRLDRALTQWLGVDAPSLSKLIDTVAQLQQAVRSLLQNRTPVGLPVAAVPKDSDGSGNRNGSSSAAAQASVAPFLPSEGAAMTVGDSENEAPVPPPTSLEGVFMQPGLPGPITSRADAYRRLQMVADYLEATEPHSPTPYLLKRAVHWGRLPLHELMQTVLREEGDLQRFVALLGIEGEQGR
ncbi:MAG: type VI secretion system protein TssA [Comamonas sp.]